MEQIIDFVNDWVIPVFLLMICTAAVWVPMFFRPKVSAWVYRRSEEVLEMLAKDIENAPVDDQRGSSPRSDEDLMILVATLRVVSMTSCFGPDLKQNKQHAPEKRALTEDVMASYKRALEKYDFASTATFSIMLLSSIGTWVSKPVFYIEDGRGRFFGQDWWTSIKSYLVYKTLTDERSPETITAPGPENLTSRLEKLPEGFALAQ
jgi:hypothetical protein